MDEKSNNLIKITDLTTQIGLSSRSLRYYEQVGLIQSTRLAFEKYRFYDAENIERLKQIIVLRKMQIPIKDILRIFESESMSVVVETFVNRIRAIDDEIGALGELKRIVSEFLQTMQDNGITKISALPLLYEEMDKQVELLNKRKPITFNDLSNISERITKPIESAIISLPTMRVISSFRKTNQQESDTEGFWRWLQTHNIGAGEPGRHEQFEYQTSAGDVFIRRIPYDFQNDSEYVDFIFDGGLFVSANVYLDEDLGERFRSLVSGFDDNKFYEVDYNHDGNLRHSTLLENLISPDEKRELVALLVPVKKRLANPTLFDSSEEITDISIAEIEEANPVLWTVDVPLDKMTPINNPHYRMTEQGEAEYISWISMRALSTNVKIKLPFRVDIEFRIGEDGGGYGHGSNETSIRFHHGDVLKLNNLFGINMNNNPDERLSQEAICFNQPIFGDFFNYPKRGGISANAYNRLTWIVGMKHFAIIINDEIRYCGVNFPYMKADLVRQIADPIIISSNSSIKRYFRSICVSQLAHIRKSKIKEGALTMVIKQSNNTIPNIHRFITSEHGENYHFNGCARYVMESLGKYTVGSDLMTDEIYNCKKTISDFGYWFFAGLTGDVLAQVYSHEDYLGECVSACMFNTIGGSYFENIFEKIGYASTFVSGEQLSANKEMYIKMIMTYIDKGIPVIAITHGAPPWGIYVGYEEHGKTLLYLNEDKSEPERIPIEQIIMEGVDLPHHVKAESNLIHVAKGWIFVGVEKRSADLAQAYRDIIINMPSLLTTKTDGFCSGAEAFRAWADGIESGKFDNVKPEDFDGWGTHVSNICNMATNGSCAHNFLKRAQGLNPDMTFLEDINKLYERTAEIWNNDNGEDLEALGGGFNVTLEALQDKERRNEIATKIREAADCMDEVMRILNDNLEILS